jgi:hypothetical protein
MILSCSLVKCHEYSEQVYTFILYIYVLSELLNSFHLFIFHLDGIYIFS